MDTPAADLSGLKIDDRLRARSAGGRRWRRNAFLALGLVLLLAAVLAALRGPATEVKLAEVRAAGGEPPTLLQASGYVTPRRRATVAAKITGRVVEVIAEEGMEVRSGQVLARLDDQDARARLEAARAEQDVAAAQLQELEVTLANARIELRRAQSLHDEGVGSVQALDAARTEVDALAARLALARERIAAAGAAAAIARQDLDNCTVRAPFDGIVVSKDAQRGEMVSPISAGGGYTRTGIATIVDMTSLEIEVDVNESFIARVAPDQRVEATLDAYPDWQIPARVRTVIPTADRQKATVKVRIAFDALDARILPDMGVRVAFLGRAEEAVAKGRPLVAKSALRKEGDETFVLVPENGRAVRRALTTGAEFGGEVEVTSGLAPGDKVIAAPPAGLAPGARITLSQEK